MSINKFKPHLYVLPEDDADRQIALGFILHPSVLSRQVQVVPPVGGWARVRDAFVDEYLPLLRQNSNTHVVLLVDFDGNVKERREAFDGLVPPEIRPRVFVVGPRENPEILRQSLGKGLEGIGSLLADECHSENLSAWLHDQLRHNEDERLNLTSIVKPFLFETRQ